MVVAVFVHLHTVVGYGAMALSGDLWPSRWFLKMDLCGSGGLWPSSSGVCGLKVLIKRLGTLLCENTYLTQDPGVTFAISIKVKYFYIWVTNLQFYIISNYFKLMQDHMDSPPQDK